MEPEIIEAIAEQVHIAWMQEKQRQGFADHVLESVPCVPWCDGQHHGCNKPYCRFPKEQHHTDMLPYADLPEHIKEYDRVTARAALAGIEAVGYRLVKD